MSDRKVCYATRPAFVGKLMSMHHTRYEGCITSPHHLTVLQYRASEMLVTMSGTQVSSIVRVAAPVASAVARTWGLF